MKQYEIRWAELPAPLGRRPVVLLTRTPGYDHLCKIVVAEVTTTIRGIPQEVALGRKEGMRERCVANFDNVHVRLSCRIESDTDTLTRSAAAHVQD